VIKRAYYKKSFTKKFTILDSSYLESFKLKSSRKVLFWISVYLHVILLLFVVTIRSEHAQGQF